MEGIKQINSVRYRPGPFPVGTAERGDEKSRSISHFFSSPFAYFFFDEGKKRNKKLNHDDNYSCTTLVLSVPTTYQLKVILRKGDITKPAEVERNVK